MSAEELISLDDSRRLELTLNARERIISTLLNGNSLPQQASDKIMLIQALDGMDRTVLTKVKIKSDDQAQKTQQQTTQLIADILLRVNANKNKLNRTEIPVLGSDVTVSNKVLGEDQIVGDNLTYDTFMAKA